MHIARCTVIVPEETVDMLTTVLARHIPFGWEEESLPTGQSLARIYCEHHETMETLAQALRTLPKADVCLDTVDNVDWTHAWRDYFTPVLCGRRFVVLPPWLKDIPPNIPQDIPQDTSQTGSRTAIVIEPRSAFGTGHHATTALCLKVLSDLLDEACLCAGMTFLDVGTGSGVLGIACCLSGLSGTAVDIDPLALDNARENAVLNKVDMPLRLGSIEAASHTPVDVVLANILDQPLRDMATDMTARVRTGGMLILSGILDIQADSVLAAYTAHGMTLTRCLAEGDWVALILKSP